jgi:hypothetical protein
MYLKNKHVTPFVKTFLAFGFFLLFILIAPNSDIAYAAVEHQFTQTSTFSTNTQTTTAIPGTPTHTLTPSATPSNTPTAPLLPLPAITLIFPVSTNTSTSTNTPRPTLFTQTPIPSNLNTLSVYSPRFTLLFILLFFLWIFLAGFLIIYIRQFR